MRMNEMDSSPVCERASDLISVLYGEASDRERREFEVHIQQCGSCRAEFGSFGHVRESIRDWRDEALAGFVASQTPPLAPANAPSRKSAVAALRQFFDLSPLWMKGAVGFAAVLFCVLAVLAVMRLGATDRGPQVATGNTDASYTKQDVDRAVQEALAQEREQQRVAQPEQAVGAGSPTPKSSNVTNPGVVKTERKSRRPFSRAEREQLAADLRLLSEDERDSYLWAEPNQ
jgi:anti-sigma factor RsiW